MKTKNGKKMIAISEINILLLDDEPFMLKLIGRMLANLGFLKVATCGSGCQALEQFDFSNGSLDLILLDINMPDMDGLEFVRHLNDRHYTGSIILVSGEDERMLQTAEKLVQVHKISILGHLRKPVTPDALSGLLEKWQSFSAPAYRKARQPYSADEVRLAISNGELTNHYQPKVDLVNGKVIGVESLVRWQHPQDGIVFPDQFIDVAETYGLINDLTKVVVTEAFAQCKKWQDDGLFLKVAVNLSMDNLAQLEFTDYMLASAIAAGITPEDVVLEVTESRLMGNVSVAMEILTRLRLKRFSLSIDDFGTGHSSQTQLRNIPFNELKIDRSFVNGAAGNATLSAIFRSNLALAQQLKMKTVAEGVENQEDWDFLCRSGCDSAQGYFIAKPMLADAIPAWIQLGKKAWLIE